MNRIFQRLSGLFLALVFLFCMLPFGSVLADFEPNADEIPTKHVILMDADTGAVLFSKDPDGQARPASTTKVMTCIVALENGNLDDIVTCGSEVTGFSSGASLMKLSSGERIELRELLYGLMMISGNDAAAAIAVHIAGSTSAFADMMNEKAAELGMTNTHFVNPHGMDKDEHYTTVRDMAILAAYAMQNGDFRAIVGCEARDVAGTNRRSSGYHLENSNKLVHTKNNNDSYEYAYAEGIKTGDTPKAGRCLIASAKKNGVRLISVQYGDFEEEGVSGTYRFELAAELFDWGFANYEKVSAGELGLPTTLTATVSDCSFEDEENGSLTLNIDLSEKSVAGLKSKISAIRENPEAVTLVPTYTDGALTAPVAAGAVVGTVEYRYEDETLFTADLVASRDVSELVTTVGSPDANGSDSQGSLLVTEPDEKKASGSSLLFWILIAVLILVIIIVIQVLRVRRIRRRRAARRRNYRYPHTR